MPVYFSLGNFISNQSEAIRMLGAMAVIDLIKDEEGIRLQNPQLIPLVTHYAAGFAGTAVYPLADYSDELASSHGLWNLGIPFSRQGMWDLVEEIIGEEFLYDGN